MSKSSAAAPRVFLVDDDLSILRALERIFSSSSYSVQTFSSAEDFLATADLQQAGCLVLDLSMPAMSGSLLQEHLLRCKSLLPVIFLTGNGDVASSVKAMKLGAFDFLTKPVDAHCLLEAVQLALALNRRLIADQALLRSIELRLGSLTKREHQVMDLVVSGRLNKQIAAELGTVEHTIKLHRASVMRKMHADSFSDLVTTINTLRSLTGPSSGR